MRWWSQAGAGLPIQRRVVRWGAQVRPTTARTNTVTPAARLSSLQSATLNKNKARKAFSSCLKPRRQGRDGREMEVDSTEIFSVPKA